MENYRREIILVFMPIWFCVCLSFSKTNSHNCSRRNGKHFVYDDGADLFLTCLSLNSIGKKISSHIRYRDIVDERNHLEKLVDMCVRVFVCLVLEF